MIETSSLLYSLAAEWDNDLKLERDEMLGIWMSLRLRVLWLWTGAEMLPTFFPVLNLVSRAFPLKKWVGKSPGDEVALALVTVPEVFAKVHSSQFPFCWVANVSWFSWCIKTIFCLFLQYKVGITLFTVSHRKSLWKYHEVCESFLFCCAVVISVQSLWMVTFELRHVCNDL